MAPETIARALDELETLMSPEALATLCAAPEEHLIEFESGVNEIMELRWRRTMDKYPPSLERALSALHVGPKDSAAYLLTALWRRRRGLSLDPDQPLMVFEKQRRRLAETIEGIRRGALARGVVITDLSGGGLTLSRDVIYFPHGITALEASQAALLDGVADMMRGNPSLLLVEAQGHASAGESRASPLALPRAQAVSEGLIQRGVASSRLTAHGLGSRFPIPEPTICAPGTSWWRKIDRGNGAICTDREKIRPAPSRDQRVELIILRRDPWRRLAGLTHDGGVGNQDGP